MSEGDVRIAPQVAGSERPMVVALDDAAALGAALTGGKASALARGRTAGLAMLPGVVLTAFSDAIDAGAPVAGHAAVRHVPSIGGRERALVARSSSVVEDSATSSMAGQFESVIGISGFDAFVAAVTVVLESRQRAGAADHPIGVLVQPLIEPKYGGVMFGIDPVTGRTDRRVVSAVRGGPEPLVSGEVDGSRYVLGVDREGSRLHRQRRPGTGLERPATTAGSVGAGRHRVRQPAGRRMGDRHRWTALAPAGAPVTTDIRSVPRTHLRPGPVAETS